MKLPIQRIDHRDQFTKEYLATLGDGPVLACDFYVHEAENWTPVSGGYQSGRVVNIDHHAPDPRMWRHWSSANLAMERLNELGPAPSDSLVVISHTDCDSVLSSGIISGELEPDPIFAAAAIAADHTGEENPVADLLQPLEKKKDVQFSLRNLRLLLKKGEEALEPEAKAALADRRRKRIAAAEVVASGLVRMEGHIAVGILPGKIDGELFIPLLPQARALLLFSRRLDLPDRWDVKLWFGLGALKGASIHQMRMKEFDPNYAGRWNAGSNSRNKGTTIPPADYEKAVIERLSRIVGPP